MAAERKEMYRQQREEEAPLEFVHSFAYQALIQKTQRGMLLDKLQEKRMKEREAVTAQLLQDGMLKVLVLLHEQEVLVGSEADRVVDFEGKNFYAHGPVHVCVDCYDFHASLTAQAATFQQSAGWLPHERSSTNRQLCQSP